MTKLWNALPNDCLYSKNWDINNLQDFKVHVNKHFLNFNKVSLFFCFLNKHPVKSYFALVHCLASLFVFHPVETKDNINEICSLIFI